ncbi:FAD-linked oxidase C-terminal domain-containing protein [Microbacterium sp. NPDC028030]|uniref:FAD-binding and (Fe-S)-binding domain-containing protein n=1 Tax=Microbacterium sp. NPDC028030 TaxID=3155124 RepID=UPI003410D61F
MSVVDPPFDVLAADLRGTVDTSRRRRAEYTSDASNYRLLPAAVVYPADEQDVSRIVRFGREHGVPVTARGGGTSIAGNAVGAGIIVDLSRHFGDIFEIDPQARTARVGAGVVLADLQRAAAAHGLRFGPDPSSQSRCTIGGMIGNNACGPRAMTWGRTSDNVERLRVVDGTGAVRVLGRGLADAPELERLVGEHLATIRIEFGKYSRQGSGFALEHLLPENGRDLAKAFVGTEGACAVVTEAVLRLVPIPAATALTVLAYSDIATAADDVPAILREKPLAIESLDAALLAAVQRSRPDVRVPDMPRGGAWLFVESHGPDAAAARSAAEKIAQAAQTVSTRVLDDGADARALWAVRADGVGLAGRTAEGQPAWAGWEDASVPPEHLGGYLRAFDDLKAEYGVSGFSYGHFGDGCVHTRIDFPLATDPAGFAEFIRKAARLVLERGGSPSGEHGDGRARGALLAQMYSPEAIALFAAVKSHFDPDDVLNPGVIVAPAPIDDDLRLPRARPLPAVGFVLREDRRDLAVAAHRCTGVGKCRTTGAAGHDFMCPSYRATGDERNTTRARARVLQEVSNGSFLADGVHSAELADSLDLCLSCKACSSDCPAGVDVATMKSEVLHQRYRGRIRPLAHYTLGRLPRWLRVIALAPRLVNTVGRARGLSRLAMHAMGADPRRSLPRIPEQTFHSWWRRRPSARRDGPEVALWADSFSNAISPHAARAAVTVLEEAGYRVRVVSPDVCCGLTLITTGQLDAAKRELTRMLDAIADLLAAGTPIVALEPSCLAVLRKDAHELLPDDTRAVQARRGVFTLAEFLTDRRGAHAAMWSPPDLSGVEIIVQPHCHHHAVMGFAADRALLENTGARLIELNGCCGLAGNFGMEKGHYDLSVAVAELGLGPALREHPDALLLADGFSCRTQADDLYRRSGMHMAELLAARGDPARRSALGTVAS